MPKDPKALWRKKLLHPLQQRLFMLLRLPSAWFWGLRIAHIDEQRSRVTLRYRWTTRNPFQSVYFATLTAAGELATGVLAWQHLQGEPSTAMLVAEVRATFSKKARGTITFTCEDGAQVARTIAAAIESGEAQRVTMCAIGRDAAHDEVARIWLDWSFKRRTPLAGR